MKALRSELERTTRQKETAEQRLAAIRKPADIDREFTRTVVAGERLAASIEATPIDVASEVWAQREQDADTFIEACFALLEEHSPRHWLKLRVLLRQRIDSYPHMIWIRDDDGERRGPFLVGRGDRDKVRVERATAIVREALEER